MRSGLPQLIFLGRSLGLGLLTALLLLCAGCQSLVMNRVMKQYPLQPQPLAELPHPNRYQQDFIYLKQLGEEVFPLEDHYFPPEKRHAMEGEILKQLGEPGCSQETFTSGVRRYLAAFNNQHAQVMHNPQAITYTGFYPFRIHYVSNEVYIADIAREYDSSIIGRRLTTINGHPLAEVEDKLTQFAGTENDWVRRTSLEPTGYSRPDFYRLAGLSSSSSNRLNLEFSDQSTVSIAPKWTNGFHWHNGPPPRHPITDRANHPYDCRFFPEQNFAYLQFNTCFDQAAILDGLRVYCRPWIRPLVRTWLALEFMRRKPGGLLEDIYDPTRPLLKDYLAESIRKMQQLQITNLILDLRYNSGGEGELGKQLIYHLSRRGDLQDTKEFAYNLKVSAYYDPVAARKFVTSYLKQFGKEPPARQLTESPDNQLPFMDEEVNPKSIFYVAPDRPVFGGRVIVLANQNTASAASILTSLLQDNDLAVVVGTTTSNNPTGPSGLNPFKLPRSGMVVSFPIEHFVRARPENGEILHPDFWVENTLEDELTGRDAAYEKALELIQK